MDLIDKVIFTSSIIMFTTLSAPRKSQSATNIFRGTKNTSAARAAASKANTVKKLEWVTMDHLAATHYQDNYVIVICI